MLYIYIYIDTYLQKNKNRPRKHEFEIAHENLTLQNNESLALFFSSAMLHRSDGFTREPKAGVDDISQESKS